MYDDNADMSNQGRPQPDDHEQRGAGRFLEAGRKGQTIASGVDGCDGYLLWRAVNEPKAYMALLARILPYYVNVVDPVGKDIMSYEDTLAELRERGLPPELIDHLRWHRRYLILGKTLIRTA